MILAASFDGSSGDAESLACNAGEKTDMGDLPGSYGYAAHTIPVFSTTPNPMYLDTVPGDDDFGTANNGVAGKGDDIDDANDDEDGVTFAGESISDMAVLQGATYALDIVTHGNGTLTAWFDWNNDGDFDDAGEQVAADLDGSSGSILLNVTIPATTADGVLFSRFRYSSDTGLGPNDDVSNGNWASDGEAEDYRLFVNPQMDVVKTSTPDHTPVEPGDTIAYTMTVSNPSALITLHNIAVTDPLPVGTNYLPNSAQVTFRDIKNGTYFDSVSTNQQYGERHGTLDWTTSPWQEINDGGSPTGGDIQILVDPAIGGTYVIQVKDNDKGIQRTADLSAYAAATLSLDYRRDDRNNSNGSVTIEASTDGVTWDPLATITVDGDDTGYVHVEYDITDKISATTTIRFLSNGLLDNDDRVYFDNILLTGTNKVQKTVPAHDPANLTVSSDGYSIFPGDELSVTFSVVVNDPLLAAISEIENTVSVTAQEIVQAKTSTVKDLLVTGTIGDFVWIDTDGEGVQDGGEPGLSGVTVFLDLNTNGTLDAGEPSDVTAANGAYDFTGLTAGSYSVQADNSTVPTGFTLIAGSDPVSITLTAGQDYNNADFGYQQQYASIGNYVWHDDDGDGIQDAEESGFVGVAVELLDGAGSTIDNMTTDGSGFYQFAGLVAGNYEIRFAAPAGYSFTAENLGSGVLQDSFDSDANIATGRSGSFSLTAGENNATTDAGMYLDNGNVVAMPIQGGNVRPIPTLSEWMLILMSAMLALIGWVRIYQQGGGHKIFLNLRVGAFSPPKQGEFR